MGYVYVGGKTNQWANGYVKIGETHQAYLSARIAQIRHKEGNFVLFQYLDIPDSTPAVTRAIEAHARMMLERDGYTQVQNDHFVMPVTKDNRESLYNDFTCKAIKHMANYCDMFGIAYEVKEGNPNAKRNVKHRERA